MLSDVIGAMLSHTYTHMYLYIHLYLYLYLSMFIYIYIYFFIYTHVCTYICIYVYMYISYHIHDVYIYGLTRRHAGEGLHVCCSANFGSIRVFLLLQERSKRPREMVLPPKASTVESRIGPERGSGLTPGELLTISKPNPYPKSEKPPARKWLSNPTLWNPLGRFNGLFVVVAFWEGSLTGPRSVLQSALPLVCLSALNPLTVSAVHSRELKLSLP